MRPLLTLILLLLVAMPAAAQRFTGTVVRVKDGDSIMVKRDDVGRVSEIRLAGIDAPELGQPWGIQSRSALRRMVDRRTVTVVVHDRDRYGRLVGRVWTGRTDVNVELVRQGHAWAFSRYLPDAAIRTAHDEARTAGRGLWSLPPDQRLPPATWRARHPARD